MKTISTLLFTAPVCAVSAIALAQGTAPVKAPAPTVLANTLQPLQTVTPADGCPADPKFLEKNGLSRRALVDTTQAQPVGMTVVDVDAAGRPTKRGQDASWAQAGYLGRVQRDAQGHIYVYPVPSFTLEFNPPDKANILYRVDTDSGVMRKFVEIDSGKKPNARNPFGLVAQALDCSQNALYVATLMGSTASEENGAIARVDLNDKSVRIVKRGIDALSLTVGNVGNSGKRLFIGSARENTLLSFPIDAKGDLGEPSRVEIQFDEVPAAQDKRARILRLNARGQLFVRAIPFEYTLAVRSTIPTAELTYDLRTDAKGEIKYSLVNQRAFEHNYSAPPPATAPTQTPVAPAKNP